ncbi:TolC family protein [Anaeromyxobacter paludicola]|uniref:Outer membrane efflux protein n=1 Tax=Anaeromyxobacter paludicola TaxID=2918171 RepID=A0ABN6NAG5_9BACT|nr:TolC family protein [Anaeromyxobacter paludicola]BDG10223.1 hypothetical protein AMPC_33360 [Anaeromyxobacter paludicola]
MGVLLTAVLAAAAASGEVVTFDEALGVAAEAPAVQAARDAVRLREERDRAISGLPGNPTIFAEPGVRPESASNKVEGTIGISQPFSLAGLGGARRDAAASERAALANEARAAALSRRLSAAEAWIGLWGAQQAWQSAQAEVRLADEFADRIARAAQAAALTRSDLAEAESYRAEARLAALAVEGEATDLGYQLARQLGRASLTPLQAAGALPDLGLPPRERWAALLPRAASLPEVQARALLAQAERARELEARASKGTQLALGLSAQRDNQGLTGAFLSAGLTLPLFDRAERESAPLAASARRLEGEHRDLAAQAQSELARALHEVEHTGELLRAIETTLVPAAVESARLREAAMNAGEATVLEVLIARRGAAAAKARLARATAAHAWARVKVSLLLGEMGGLS